MEKKLRQIFFGVGHLFDFSGCFTKTAMRNIRTARRERLPRTAFEAMQIDMGMVGADMRKALDKYKEQHG